MTARAEAFARLRDGGRLDLAVIGGGVTGAAVLHEASRRGLRAALFERNDFASGTSSRSSKLVHGGLRYLKEGKIALTRESVRERQELLRDAPGLVEPIEFVMPHYRGRSPGPATLALGLAFYDLLAGSWQHRYLGRAAALRIVPELDPRGLSGAHAYLDATTDDARLVLRLLQEARAHGAIAFNYAGATPLLEGGRVAAVRAHDAIAGTFVDVEAAAVVAATGVFSDAVRASVGAGARMRPLRGSHLIVDERRLPLSRCVAFEHPDDRRPVFAYPWLGRTLVGTTDLDHAAPLDDEPSIAASEVAYLLAALHYQFPAAEIAASDVVSTYAGVRPIVDASGGAPSKASRDHVVWNESGLITIAGGKLTTFRPMAMDALAAAAPQLPPFDRTLRPVFAAAQSPDGAPGSAASRRLAGRFGARAAEVIAVARAGELETVGDTPYCWAELRWSARHESVERLDDLLLRRTRAGALARAGASEHFARVASICAEELGWDAARWEGEAAAYLARVRTQYGVPA